MKIKIIVSLIFTVLFVYSCALGASAYNEAYMNERVGDELQEVIITDNGELIDMWGGDRLDTYDDYLQVTQNDSESTDDTDIKESADNADTAETDFDEVEKEILRSAVAQFYEKRAVRKKELEKKHKRIMLIRDIVILCIILIMKSAKDLANKITNKNR